MKVQQFVLIANWLKPSYRYFPIEIFVRCIKLLKTKRDIKY